jgi:hypothetical protein
MADLSPCDEWRDTLPELAAGVVSGETRARALAHVDDCAGCRRELAELSAVLDGLVLLAPEHEPSPGFESSVLAALAPEPRPGRRPRAAALALAASVLAVALAVGVGWWRSAQDDDVVVADVTYATSTVAGQAVARQGDPPWVYLDLDAAPAPGRYLVRLVTTDDRALDVGWCDIRGGKGSWGWRVDVPPGDLREVQLVRDGEVAMSGSFR